jgi:hypothetical protein
LEGVREQRLLLEVEVLLESVSQFGHQIPHREDRLGAVNAHGSAGANDGLQEIAHVLDAVVGGVSVMRVGRR